MKRFLFVCVEHSCRSQMAEAFARACGEGVEVHSAGSEPSGAVDETARELLRREEVLRRPTGSPR